MGFAVCLFGWLVGFHLSLGGCVFAVTWPKATSEAKLSWKCFISKSYKIWVVRALWLAQAWSSLSSSISASFLPTALTE